MNVFIVNSAEKDREAYFLLRDSSVLGLDTETSGLSFISDALWSVQLSNGTDVHVLYDHTKMEFYPFLNQLLKSPNTVKAAHSASFDLKFLWRHNYSINNAYCIKVAEQVLEAGRKEDFALRDLVKEYCGVELNKEIRKDFHQMYLKKPGGKAPLGVVNENYFGIKKEWTPELIEYAISDVIYLPKIYEKQVKKSHENNLRRTFVLEQMLLPEIAYTEYRGIEVDLEELARFEADMLFAASCAKEKVYDILSPNYKQRHGELQEALSVNWNNWKIAYDRVLEETKKSKIPGTQRLTEEAKAARETIRKAQPKKPSEYSPVNLDSPEQLKAAFKTIGINLSDTKKSTFEDLIDDYPVIKDYLAYNKYKKLSEFAKIKGKIDKDGRVHCSLNQNGTETGRMSCSSPNLQNQPARSAEGKRLRACFKAGEGEKLVVADYAAIELVILGVLSHDKKILEAINEDKDLHFWTMHFFLNCSYDDLVEAKATGKTNEDLDKAIEKFKGEMHIQELANLTGAAYVVSFRDYIKTLVYGTVYGLSSFGLAKRFRCSRDVAGYIIDLFFKIYSNVADFLKSEANKGFYRGFTANINGRIRYYDVLAKPVRAHYPDSKHNDFMKAMREYHKREGRVRRQASNSSIQSVSADITKLACLKTAAKLLNAGIPREYGIVLIVHDEIVIRVREQDADKAASILEEAMAEAAYQILGSVAKIEVHATIQDFWKK